MVCRHCVYHNMGFFILFTQIHTDLNMGTLHLVVNGFSNIMEQTCTFCHPHICAHFSGQQSGQKSALDSIEEMIGSILSYF